MSTTTHRSRLTAAAGATLAAVALTSMVGVAPATAGDGVSTDVSASGFCSAGSLYDLEAENDGSRIEVSFDVDTSTSGQTWKIRLTNNGSAFFTGTRVTDDEGDWDVDRSTSNTSGTNTIKASTRNTQTGETCQATVRL